MLGRQMRETTIGYRGGSLKMQPLESIGGKFGGGWISLWMLKIWYCGIVRGILEISFVDLQLKVLWRKRNRKKERSCTECTDKLFSTFKDAGITRKMLFIDEGNAGTLCIYQSIVESCNKWNAKFQLDKTY